MVSLPSYYDFPACREAFARGQKDARPHEEGGCHYRLRGRTRNHWTLLSFSDPLEAWEQMRKRAAAGDRVQGVNHTSPRPECPVRRGPTEWQVDDFPSLLRGASGQFGRRMRRLERQGCDVAQSPSAEDVGRVFQEWAAWAAGRHFMVFRGHYLAWLDRHCRGVTASTRLVGVRVDGRLEGIFGWEELGDVSQILIAKHTPRLEAKALWVAGLLAVGSRPTLCGSTADKLKREIGLQERESWMFDLSKLKLSLKV